VNPGLAPTLTAGFPSRLRRIMFRYRLLIKLETDAAIPFGEFRVISQKQERDITDQFKS
jgi:hypothetical protein